MIHACPRLAPARRGPKLWFVVISADVNSDVPWVAISALQHWLYCPRQCALIHVEHAWAENQLTAEGRKLHERAHNGPTESRPGVKVARGMQVASEQLHMSGQCDIVEFHRALPDRNGAQVVPVEYKRGRPKAHRADEVQLCAQALCLEEMLEATIPRGFLFYGKEHRRTEVTFDPSLRQLVLSTLEAVRDCLIQGSTPAMDYAPQRCDRCSLIDICQPKAMRFRRGASQWFSHALGRSTAADVPNDDPT